MSQIAARARKEQQRLERQGASLDVVVVDHMHIMAATNRYAGSRVNEVSEISAGLKALAKELRTPVLALAQLNRQVENREEKRPHLADLRDSGSIEQDADAVIFAYRSEYYDEQPCDDPDAEIARQERLGRTKNILELIVASNAAARSGRCACGLMLPPIISTISNPDDSPPRSRPICGPGRFRPAGARGPRPRRDPHRPRHACHEYALVG